MPRNGSGTYTLPKPAFVPNTTISSADVNSDFSDIASALTGSLASDGQTPITGQLKFPAGTATTPSHTFSTELTSGMYLPSAGVVGITTLGVATVFFDGTKVGTGLSGDQFYYANGAIPGPVANVGFTAASTAPTGWLLCYGQAISRTGYPELFFKIGTTYGSGDGTTTFNLPDGRGRTSVGRANMGGSQTSALNSTYYGTDPNGLGNFGGSQSLTLGQDNIPSYNFSLGSVGVGISDTRVWNAEQGNGATSGASALAQGAVTGVSTTIAVDVTSGSISASITGSINSGGSSIPFSLVQPSIIFNMIIFAGRP